MADPTDMTDTEPETTDSPDEVGGDSAAATPVDETPAAPAVDLGDDAVDAPEDAAESGAAVDEANAGEPGSSRHPSVKQLEQEGEVAADYLEELLDICDLDGDLDLDVEGDRAVVAIVGEGLGDLVGTHGKVLDALQELTRLAILAKTGERSRLMLDVAGYRVGKRSELTELGSRTAREVVSSGEAKRLRPMTPFERKIVHDAVSAVQGVRTESEGLEPQRRVVVLPA